MVKFEKYHNFIQRGQTDLKKRIVLCHTSREADEYLASLKFRYNSRYDKIPNYLVKKDGTILQLMEDKFYNDFFHDEELNQDSVVVTLENLGWLEKKPLSNHYISWKGSIYYGEIFEKKWRDFFFWDPYTEIQTKNLASLCLQILETNKIKKNCVGHNTKIDGIKNFEGVITRSNLNSRFTDLNPSFDFENFLKLIENEQYTQ